MSLIHVQPQTPAPPPAPDPRVTNELTRARDAARDAERAAGRAGHASVDVRPVLAAQAPTAGVVTSSDQEGTQQTTIQHDGKTTTISTDPSGVTTIRENGKVTTVIDPQAIGRDAARAASRAIAAQPPMGPFGPSRGDLPDGVIQLIGMVLSILAIIIIGFPISRAFARRMDRRAAPPAPPDPELSRRLDRIEQAIETMAVEVERVSEAQRYSARLLTERLPEAPARSIAAAEPVR